VRFRSLLGGQVGRRPPVVFLREGSTMEGSRGDIAAEDRSREAVEERKAHEASERRAEQEAVETRKADEAAERTAPQEAVSESGALSQGVREGGAADTAAHGVVEGGAANTAAEALREGGAANTAAEGAPEIASAPKNIAKEAAGVGKKVSGDVADTVKGTVGRDDSKEPDQPSSADTGR
jgi:hypothetical protein